MSIDHVMNKDRKARIMLVEDNPGDVILMKRAIAKSSAEYELSVVTTGEDALERLKNDSSLPDLILLDLNLPRISGLDVLKAVKESEKLRYIPVIITSSSRAEKDVVSCSNMHANAYVPKPLDIKFSEDAFGKMLDFWLRLAILPDVENIMAGKR